MKTFKLRVQYEAKDDKEIYRDIVVAEGQNLEQLHKSIIKAFDFDGDEMASFYESDHNWEKGREYPLEDMGEVEDGTVIMKKAKIEDMMSDNGDKLVYIYDFMKMSTFLLEVTEIGKKEDSKKYPLVTASAGDMPEDNDGDEDGEEDDDVFADDPDLAESYYTKVGGSSGGKKGKKGDDDEEEEPFDDFQDGYDEDDYGNKSDYDEYY
ncbi:MAG: hypothetical protein V4616_13485 [Bacteroidota bacterium]